MQVRHAAAALAVGAVAAPLAIASASTGAQAPVRAAAAQTTVTTHSTNHGKVLATSSGMPLYVYTLDSKHHSACSSSCAQAWPPLIRHGSLRARGGVKVAKLKTIKRGGSRQVSYAGHPLYTFVGDSPGHATGEGVPVNGGTFYVISASGKVIK